MIILVGSIKVGVGKSTIATSLAVALAQSKGTVCLLDADRQGSSVNWAADREAAEFTPQIVCVQQFYDLVAPLTSLDETHDYVVVDCQGRDSQELRSALVCADVLLTPFKPSQLDLDTLHAMSLIVADVKELNPNLQAFGLLSIVSTHSSTQDEIKSAVEIVSKDSNIKTLNTIIYDRKVYREAVAMGAGVTELPNQKAREEFLSLLNEVCDVKITR